MGSDVGSQHTGLSCTAYRRSLAAANSVGRLIQDGVVVETQVVPEPAYHDLVAVATALHAHDEMTNSDDSGSGLTS